MDYTYIGLKVQYVEIDEEELDDELDDLLLISSDCCL